MSIIKIAQYKGGDIARRILTAMIVDSTVLSRVSSLWDGNLFESVEPNLIASWCVDYFQRYDKAPNKNIENLFRNWAEHAQDETMINLIENLLQPLNGEYQAQRKAINPEFTIDMASKYFNQVRAKRLAGQIEDGLAAGKLPEVLAKITSFSKVEIGDGGVDNAVIDQESINSTFNEDFIKPIIRYPGAVGKFFGDAFARDSFVCFRGPDKVGKSFWLLDVAIRALMQRRRTILFQVGDMSNNQVKLRIYSRIAQHPKYAGTVQYPLQITPGKHNARVTFKTKDYKESLNAEISRKACKRIMETKVRSKDPYLKLSCHPSKGINVEGIKSILLRLDKQGWTADCVVIDYADLIAAPDGTSKYETRDQINEIWIQLRALSQTMHICLVTATQSDTPGYNTHLLGKENFSGDKRQNAHVTGMIGLNVTPVEKELGITRLNWIVRREGAYSSRKAVNVAGCLALANPCIVSCW